MNRPTSLPGDSTPSSAVSPSRLAARATRATLAAATLAILLNWPGAASATPAVNFASDTAKASFDSLDIIYGQGPKNDLSSVPRPDPDPKILFMVKDPADYYIVTNTVLPGGNSGWHTHPGPSVVIVKLGVASVYDGDDPTCTPAVYPAGTGFVDPGDGHVHMVSNDGSSTLVTEAFQIIPSGENRRIDAPSPGNCSF